MELWDALKSRRSVRAFLPEEVPEEVISRILGAAILAPSAGNVQPWFFYVVRDDYLKKKLVDAALGQAFIAQAPVVIVACADVERARAAYQRRGETLYCYLDTAAAVQNLLLAAHALGYGACWVGAFDEGSVSRLLEIPPAHRPVAVLPIGRPARAARDPGRRSLDEVVSEVD